LPRGISVGKTMVLAHMVPRALRYCRK